MLTSGERMKLALLAVAPMLLQAATPWNLKELSRVPQTQEVATTEPGVRALYYESVPWRGKPTRVFAYYGAPKGTKLPAMVLVHGGGGTAFAEWVRMWNQRGYAAIAMDTCGAAPEAATAKSRWNPPRKHHEQGGPMGWGGFDQIEEPLTDQWTYHAVAAAVRAHSLIRSFPEVDPKRVGVTGISWGGYLTSILSGVDPRFRFAIPVYGCGFLGEDSAWLKTFAEMGKERSAKWLAEWDPSVYLPASKMPMLWVNGTNDFAYPLPSHQKSYRLTKGPRTLAIRVGMKHGHGEGARPGEIFAFADSMVGKGPALAKITRATASAVEYRAKRPVARAELNYTVDKGNWQERKWKTVEARLDARRHKAEAAVPEGATAWYFNLFDEQGLVVSSEVGRR